MGIALQAHIHARWGKDIRGAERAVLNVLAFHASDDTGWAFPSIETIADEAGVTGRCAQKAIASLAARQAIVREDQAGPNRVNRYRVLRDAELCSDGEAPVLLCPVEGERDDREGARGTPGGERRDAEGELRAPKPTVNRQLTDTGTLRRADAPRARPPGRFERLRDPKRDDFRRAIAESQLGESRAFGL